MCFNCKLQNKLAKPVTQSVKVFTLVKNEKQQKLYKKKKKLNTIQDSFELCAAAAFAVI